jgi:hypothetical protein
MFQKHFNRRRRAHLPWRYEDRKLKRPGYFIFETVSTVVSSDVVRPGGSSGV